MEQSQRYSQDRNSKCFQISYPPNVVRLGTSIPQQFISSSTQINSEILVHVGDIRSPSQFWVILKEGLVDVSDLMYYIQEIYYNEKQSQKLQIFERDVTEGMFCVTLYEGEYNRGLVRKVNINMHQVEVLFVDYGTVALVDSRKLYFLLNKFSYLPQQAIKAKLARNETKWSIEATQKFSSLVNEFKELTARIVRIDVNYKILTVILVDNEKGESIGVALAKYKFSRGENSSDTSSDHNNSPTKFKFPLDVLKPRDVIGKQFVLSSTKEQDEIDFYVGEILNPSKFWLIFQSGFEDLLILLDKMHKTYTEELRTLKIPEEKLKEDMYCVAVDGDEYSRVRVTKLMLEDHKAEIFCVDFGTVSIVDSRNLLFLLNQFKYLPEQAIEARLGGIRSSETNWSAEATQKFKNMFCEYKIVTARFLTINWDKKMLEVSLVDKSNDVCINNALVEDKLALNVIPKETQKSSTNNHFIQKSETKIPRPDSVMLDIDIPNQFDVSNFKKDDKVLLRVSEILNPSKIWVILNNSFNELQKLTEEMHQMFDNGIPKMRIPHKQLRDGMLCIARNDFAYCRAIITKVRWDDGKVDIFCIDYGKSSSANSTQLHFLYERFAGLPQQAIKATLMGIVPREPTKTWSDKTVKIFSAMAKEKPLLFAGISGLDKEKKILKVKLLDDYKSDNRKWINNSLIQD